MGTDPDTREALNEPRSYTLLAASKARCRCIHTGDIRDPHGLGSMIESNPPAMLIGLSVISQITRNQPGLRDSHVNLALGAVVSGRYRRGLYSSSVKCS